MSVGKTVVKTVTIFFKSNPQVLNIDLKTGYTFGEVHFFRPRRTLIFFLTFAVIIS